MSGVNEGTARRWLISHGSERTTRGGPTTRIGQIEREIHQRGGDATWTAAIQDALAADASPSLIHVFNSWPLKTALQTLALARRTGAPVVFSPIMLNLADRAFYDTAVKHLLRDSISDRQVEDGARLIMEMTPLWDPDSAIPPRQGESGHFDMIRRQVALADHVICLSQYEQGLLRAIGADVSQCQIVPNGVDAATMVSGDASLFTDAFGVRDFFLMVGRIEPRKNQALTAFALRELDVPLVCIGHVGDADYFAELKRWAGPKFIHIERIDDRALLASAYKAARAMLLPSWSEGAPLVALEAGAAGTPLILSATSSEREYFGDWARYAHPCDLTAIRDAAQAQLDTPDSDERRQQRSAYTSERYSIERHVDNTLAVYDAAQCRRVDETDAVLLDATHLAHQFRNDKPLTGVPRVELDLGRALHDRKPDLKNIAWSSLARRHFDVPAGQFGTPAMGPLADRPAPEPDAHDILCRPAEIRISPVSAGRLTLKPERGPGPARRGLTLFKHTLNALPGGLNRSALGLLRRAKPGFSPVVLPEHHLLERARKGPARTRHDDASLGQVRLGVSLVPEPRTRLPDLPRGARLVVLGHPWISNDRYLDDLTEAVARNALKLHVHVPDILYVTRPDTFDAETSAAFKARLLRLLQISDTVLTISQQSEDEIRAFAAVHGLDRPIRRILPGMADLPDTPAAHEPPADIAAPYALYVASMSERKRHDFLIDCWRAARKASAAAQSARLVLVGRPLPGFERFQDPAHQARLREDGVIILNNCPQEQLAELYRHATFTVYPSAAEGWGLPPVESLIAGTPCLVSAELPVARELASDGMRRLPADDAAAWTRALQDWLDSPDQLAGTAAQARAFTPPQWDDAAQIILAP